MVTASTSKLAVEIQFKFLRRGAQPHRINLYYFARLDIAFQIVGKRIEGNGFGGDGIGFSA